MGEVASERLSAVLVQLLERFPGDSALLASLFIENAVFRAVCEDLALAKNTLQKLEAFQQEGQRPQIAEYRQLISELESEVADVLANAKKPK